MNGQFWYRDVHGEKRAGLWCFELDGCVHQVKELGRVWEIIDRRTSNECV